ncbi:Beige/BEACH domain-containing protein [Spironucleus salmonicida]|nr:Beige/BEACH domain-containing protein [Spironucleus salmonicida]
MRSYKFQEISVFSFILSINYLAGRSYDDLYQYPIFPMISENRIYSEIIGKQCQDIVDKLEQKLKDNKESITEAKNSLFQTFYSHRAVASHFLFKVEPFTSIQRYLQNGVYDCYDRQFHSIQSQWDKIMTGKSLSELTPELFSTMEFYTNINNLDYNETYQFKQDGLIELDKVFYNLTKFRTQLETNQHINSWIQLIFGNQIPENTFPHFSKKQQYQSFSDPELLKSLFYGVEPDQVLEKLYIYERKVKINFQSKEGISANFQCQELPLPYFISPEIDQVLEIEEHNVKIYQLQKGAERILIWQVPTGSRAQFAKFLGPQEVLILAFNEFFLVTQNRIQPLHIDLPIKCFVQTESRRIFCLYQDCIYIYQVYDFNFRAQFVVQVEYYDQVYTFKNAWNGGLTSLFLRENRIFFQYFNSALRQVLNVELSRGCIYADFIYFYDFPRWIGTISKDGFQVLEFESLQVVYEISGAFVSFSQTGRREIGIKGPKDTIIVSM